MKDQAWKPVKTPSHCHPAVRRMIEEMNLRRVSFFKLSVTSGIGESTLRYWTVGGNPGLDLLEAALNALDLELVIRPRRMPPEVQPRTCGASS